MFTLGEMPENSPVTFASDALLATVNADGIKLWVAPEALVNSSQYLDRAVKGMCIGGYSSRHIYATEVDPPSVLRSYWVEEDELADWQVRLFEVKISSDITLPAFVVASENNGPDRAAEVSAEGSVPEPDFQSASPLEIWYGTQSVGPSYGAVNPELYLGQKLFVLSNIAHYGVELPIRIDGASEDIDKVMAGGFMRSFLSSLLEYIGRSDRNDMIRFHHACIAYYNILVENDVIMPRQVMPGVFDAAFRSCGNLSGDWEVNMDSTMRLLGGPTSIDSSGDWSHEDIVHEYDEEESFVVAGLQGLDERFPDGIFKSYIVVINNPEIAKFMMPLEDLADYMDSQGVPFPHEGLDKSLAYTYSTIVSWRNSAFREWVSRNVDPKTGVRPELFLDDDIPTDSPNSGVEA